MLLPWRCAALGGTGGPSPRSPPAMALPAWMRPTRWPSSTRTPADGEGRRIGPESRPDFQGGPAAARRRPAGLRRPVRRHGIPERDEDAVAPPDAAQGGSRGGFRGRPRRSSARPSYAEFLGCVAYALPPWRSSTAPSPTGRSASSTPSPTTHPRGLYVLGDQPVDTGRLALGELGMPMTGNGQSVSVGTGAACLGHPLRARLLAGAHDGRSAARPCARAR